MDIGKLVYLNELFFTGVRSKFGSMQVETASRGEQDLEAELARVHAMLALNSKVYKVFMSTCTLFCFD